MGLSAATLAPRTANVVLPTAKSYKQRWPANNNLAANPQIARHKQASPSSQAKTDLSALKFSSEGWPLFAKVADGVAKVWPFSQHKQRAIVIGVVFVVVGPLGVRSASYGLANLTADCCA